ncbi:hypothetical protein DPU05_14655 [Salmonella enterica subsp. enterica serovar Teddington]|nr:hypothetical protein [Salmonella enterica]EBW5579097.1 hypothetical protein [Salmonella enterica subsp. enterica serovar Teddington]
MVITILDEQSNVVEIIPAYFSDVEAIAAAKEAVLEAVFAGKTFTAIDEDGENVLPPSFSAPVKNPEVKFEGYETDQLGDNLAIFSGVYAF